MFRSSRSVIFALVALFALVACSQTSVRHLERKPWALDSNQSLTMKFWHFDYRIAPVGNQFTIVGTAYPKPDAMHQWPAWIDDIWFAAYLSNAKGTVLAQDLRVLPPGPMDIANGINFEFMLKPDSLPTKDELFVTFGYRMKLTTPPENRAPDAPVFFASEGAMTRF